MIRGRLDEPSRDELRFYEDFPGILLDDSEVPHNDLVTILRDVARKYWKEKENERKRDNRELRKDCKES